MVIAERTTSYGFLAAISGVKPIAVAQQGVTDLWPETSMLLPLKKKIQNYAFQKADLDSCLGKSDDLLDAEIQRRYAQSISTSKRHQFESVCRPEYSQ